MKKFITVVLVSLAVIFAIPTVIFLGARIYVVAVKEDGSTFRNDAFGIAAKEVLPDISTLPAEAETELHYHKEFTNESYRLTLQFDEEQTFASYCENVIAGISEQSEPILYRKIEFHKIPAQKPTAQGYWDTNYYVVVDPTHQRLSYLYVYADEFGFCSEEDTLEHLYQRGILPNR